MLLLVGSRSKSSTSSSSGALDLSRTSAEEADVGSSADVDESTACESDGSAGEQEELNLLQTVKLQF